MKSHNFFFAFLISKAYLYYLVYHPDRFIFMCMSVSTMPCLISQCSMQQHIYIFIAAVLYYLLEVVPARLPLLNVQIKCP